MMLDYRDTPPSVRLELLDLFVERALEDDAHVHVCGPDQVEETLAQVLAGRPTVVSRHFPWWVATPVSRHALRSATGTPVEAVATTAALGVATTGTLVLTHGREALELQPEVHACVLRAEQVVTGMPEAIAALNPHESQTWVAGPGADNEIELDRVDMAMSARALHIVLVGSGDRSTA